MKFRIEIQAALEAVQKNLDDHVVELKDAQDVWIEDVRKEMQALADAVDRNGIKASNEKLNTLFFHRPKDNRLEYSKFIGAMVRAKASGETHIEMDEDDYDAVFQDNWDWRKQSKLSNISYASRKH